MPSQAAEARGSAAGEAIVAAHAEANNGALPETVAVNLWGLDSIKTRGDNVGMVLYLVGARPVKEGTGRIARFELIPLEELGRPRIDVLCNMSGIFRCGPARCAAGMCCSCTALLSAFARALQLLPQRARSACAGPGVLRQNASGCGAVACSAAVPCTHGAHACDVWRGSGWQRGLRLKRRALRCRSAGECCASRACMRAPPRPPRCAAQHRTAPVAA